jgi:hypothetical protein
MVFGLSSSESRQRGTHQRSSAIGPKFSIKTEILKPRNNGSQKAGNAFAPQALWSAVA